MVGSISPNYLVLGYLVPFLGGNFEIVPWGIMGTTFAPPARDIPELTYS